MDLNNTFRLEFDYLVEQLGKSEDAEKQLFIFQKILMISFELITDSEIENHINKAVWRNADFAKWLLFIYYIRHYFVHFPFNRNINEIIIDSNLLFSKKEQEKQKFQKYLLSADFSRWLELRLRPNDPNSEIIFFTLKIPNFSKDNLIKFNLLDVISIGWSSLSYYSNRNKLELMVIILKCFLCETRTWRKFKG